MMTGLKKKYEEQNETIRKLKVDLQQKNENDEFETALRVSAM